jgi:hypothetical protein
LVPPKEGLNGNIGFPQGRVKYKHWFPPRKG